MDSLLKMLPARGRRGSLARCAIVTHGSKHEVASRLTNLVAPHGVVDPNLHVWCPTGFNDWREAELDKMPPFLSVDQRHESAEWWFAVRHPFAKSPTWDIVSQALIGDRQGLILIEAKAHDIELEKEECGKQLGVGENSKKNHIRIGECISGATKDLRENTGVDWALSRDWHYQMSNRFAWAWRVTKFGIPVILVYLGFLQARDMADRGRVFATLDEWSAHVKSHSNCIGHMPLTGETPVRHKRLFPDTVWDHTFTVSGHTLTPIIRACTVALPAKPCPEVRDGTRTSEYGALA